MTRAAIALCFVALAACGDSTIPGAPQPLTLRGEVAGLAGDGLVLTSSTGEQLAIAENGPFAFSTAIPAGVTYEVKVATQPRAPAQTCTVTDGVGPVAVGEARPISVVCRSGVFFVGGRVIGLEGTGLIITNNGADDLAIAADGEFAFPVPAATDTSFAVTVKAQPRAPAQQCSVAGGVGTIGQGHVTTVVVNCASNLYTIGGSVTGLAGTGLTLANGEQQIEVTSNGGFALPAPVPGGTPYAITIARQPSGPSQTCTLSGGTGTVADAEVTNVRVTCATNVYSLGGTVSGLEGRGLVLGSGAQTATITGNGGFAFAAPVASGERYGVTVLAQPASPSQTCVVHDGAGTITDGPVTGVAVTCTTDKYTIGGIVVGLAGPGLVLRDNGGDELPVAANGVFAFPTPIASGAAYAVTVASSPSTPTQTCVASGASGLVGAGPVTTVIVSCARNTYTLGGATHDLAGADYVLLRNQGGAALAVAPDAAFVFPTPVASGESYEVTATAVRALPGPPIACTVRHGSGVVANTNIADVDVTCATEGSVHTIGGTVSGLAGTGLVLANGGEQLPIAGNGPFTFPTPLATGASYAVSVMTQPSGERCEVTGGSGTVASVDVTTIGVTCAPVPPDSFTVGGTVTGLVGDGLVLRDNGGDALPITGDGPFTFPTALANGATYAVTVLAQPTSPAQTCTVTSGSGTIAGANVTTVHVACTTNTYAIGGTVEGLTGTGLVLRDNGGDALPITGDGPFTFATKIASGATYAVTVQTQPTSPTQTCTVTNAGGTVTSAAVTNVRVRCTTNVYTIGGTVEGLAGTGLVLRDNGTDDLLIADNGSFTFTTKIASGATYAVTVHAQPASPAQTCTVAGGTGTVTSANVTSVRVTCTTNTYAIGGTVTGLVGHGLVLYDNGGDALPITGDGPFSFPTKIASEGTYAVTVHAQPTDPAQTCVVTGGAGTVTTADVTSVRVTCTTNTYTIGGTVTGLAGTGLKLRNNGGDELVVAGDTFTFATPIASGATYDVKVQAQPSSPTQTCTVTSGTGTVTSANVTTVRVTCTTTTYTLGGTVSGMSGTGLVLQVNGGDDRAVAADGPFTFATPIASGTAYVVTVKTQPPAEQCTVTDGSGTVTSADVTSVRVVCEPLPPSSFTIGGSVTGLVGAGLVLRDNGGDDLLIVANGAFTFSSALAAGDTYAVTVQTQPSSPTQTCTVTDGTGTVPDANVTTVRVTCTTNTYTVGGTVAGLVGHGLVLRDNGGDPLPITGNGPFTFPTALASGTTYAVTVSVQPSDPAQTCIVTGGTGTVTNANVTSASITCTTNTYTIGGTVTGLVGHGLVLYDNGGDALPITGDGPFTFATPIASNGTYAITVHAQPTTPAQTCTVSGGTGTVTTADVTSVRITCATNTYTIGGTVTGLTGTGLVLRNHGGDDLVVSGGTFTFATPLASGETYDVKVQVQPSNPTQTCEVTGSAGTVTDANVTTVRVTCTTNTYRIRGAVSGLEGNGLVLVNNQDDPLPITGDGVFAFDELIASGDGYKVEVQTQPSDPAQTCTVTGGTGTVTSFDVDDVVVSCTTIEFPIAGKITGLIGSGLVLQNNGADDLVIDAGATMFQFSKWLPIGAAYAVTIKTPPSSPSQECKLSGASGIMPEDGALDIVIDCLGGDGKYFIGGQVSGLVGSGLVLQNNGADLLEITQDGGFKFDTPLPPGDAYDVTVHKQPEGQKCVVTHGAGVVADANVTDVEVRCTTGSLVAAVVTGDTHACALLDAGGVTCWGRNHVGQLGVGDHDNRGDDPGEIEVLKPIALGKDLVAVELAAGANHTCALFTTGRVKCWGANNAGQLGLGDHDDRGGKLTEMGDALPFVDLGAERTAVAIAAGGDHTCALLDDATVKCWGANGSGQLGLGDDLARGDDPNEMGDALPGVDLGAADAIAIAAGDAHTCALLDDTDKRYVKCWGANAEGQLGLGDTHARGTSPDDMVALQPLPLAGVTGVVAGGEHTCASLQGGAVRCWGANALGQLGLGETNNRGDDPGELEELPPIELGAAKVLAAGGAHTCALTETGLQCWGANEDGQLGLGDRDVRGDEPDEMGGALPAVSLGTGRTPRAIATGKAFTCAVLDDAGVKCWGANKYGQLGLGDTTNRGDHADEMGDALPEVGL